MLKTFTESAAAALASLVLCTSPAEALAVRAWVSGHGSDVAGCGSPANPCRTPQYAFTNIVSVGGEIDILDPAGYGTLNITHSISVINDGVGTAGIIAASGSAILVNAGASDIIHLRGLNIEGLGSADVGIRFNGGALLSVEHCVVHGFALDGIVQLTSTNSALNVIESLVANNGQVGVDVTPIGTGAVLRTTISRTNLTNNTSNLQLFGTLAPSGAIRLSVIDTTFTGSTSANGSIYCIGGSTTISGSITSSLIANAATGLVVDGGTCSLTISRTAFSENTSPYVLQNGGTLKSYADNNMVNNTNQGTGTLTPAVAR